VEHGASAPKDPHLHYGDSFDDLNVTWKDDDGIAQPLTGWTPHFAVRAAYSDANPTLLLEHNTGLLLDEPEGTVAFVATPAQMMAGSPGLVEGQSYVYDLEVRSPDGKVKTLLAGKFWVDYQVTTP
jgi:hypothetical protein